MGMRSNELDKVRYAWTRRAVLDILTEAGRPLKWFEIYRRLHGKEAIDLHRHSHPSFLFTIVLLDEVLEELCRAGLIERVEREVEAPSLNPLLKQRKWKLVWYAVDSPRSGE